ncbi:MAG: choice-of-anchor D domain-containing protein [Deltaproteobacteria bacterium]|nr:choice-of-anchor D domain-containing protein [Deltaproteobacteria bacterium]
MRTALPNLLSAAFLTILPACGLDFGPHDTVVDANALPDATASADTAPTAHDAGHVFDAAEPPDVGRTPDAAEDAATTDAGLGEILSCILKADPSSLDFGSLAGGRVSVKDFSLVNLGERFCLVSEIVGPTKPEFKIVAITSEIGLALGGAPFAIAPRSRARVSVEYAVPNNWFCHDDQITFVNDSVNSPRLDMYLTGGCGHPGLCKFKVQPLGTLNFGNVCSGVKKTMGVTFENVGTDFCEITHAKFGAQTGNWFSFADELSFPIEVQPGASKKIGVVCEPKGTGPAPNSSGIPDIYGWNVLNTSTNDPAQPRNGGASTCASPGWCHKLLCTGTGCPIDVVPGEIDFGLIVVGCASEEVGIKYYNNGTAVLNVSQLEIAPAANPPVFIIAQSPPVPFAVAANSSVEIKLKFRPSKNGVETGALRIHTDAPNANNGVVEVPLRGEGTPAESVTDTFTGNAGYLPDGTWWAEIEFHLSRWPDPATIVVSVNGVEVQSDPVNGYTYDAAQNSVVFGAGAVPPEGARIEVTYCAACY